VYRFSHPVKADASPVILSAKIFGARCAMIEVHCRPAIERHRKGGWELVLWTGNAFDYSTPFREMLADIAALLNREAPTSLELPEYEPFEDDVEGQLQFGSQTIRVYYEHSISYLALISDSEPMLQKIAGRLQPLLALVVTAPLTFDAKGRLRAAVHVSPTA
jgi:hypothetical protein